MLAAGDWLLAEWIRYPHEIVYSITAAVFWLVAAAWVFGARGFQKALAGVLVFKALGLGLSQFELARIGRDWDDVREERVEHAAAKASEELRAARAKVERIAAAAARLDLPADLASVQEQVFDRLDQIVSGEGLEVGVMIIDADGTVNAWAGRSRLMPGPVGDSIDFRHSRFYAEFQARRHLEFGRLAVASLLLAADPAIPATSRSLASRLERSTGVRVEILPVTAAPDTSDVFDFVEPTVGGRLGDTLFSVRLRPPEQEAAHREAFRTAVVRTVLFSILGWILAVIVAPPGAARFVVVAIPALIAIRAPLDSAIGLPALFSRRTFFHDILGPVSRSAGPLLIVSALVVMLAFQMLARPPARRRWGIPIAALIAFGAPYAVSKIGEALAVPAEGADVGLWLAWQLTVFLSASALVLIASALVARRQDGPIWPAMLGILLAITAAVIGIDQWNARHGWPDWYPLLWVLALVGVLWPGRRALTIVGVGIAVGSGAAVMVWGSEARQRMLAARSDLASLGARSDSLAFSLLQRFVARAATESVPESPSELLALWRSAPIGNQGYPVALSVWTPAGNRVTQLKLYHVDLPDSLIADQVKNLPPDSSRVILPFYRIPSVHYLALLRMDSTVLAVGLGPRTTLVPLTRLGRVLEPRPSERVLYHLAIEPTGSSRRPTDGAGPLWYVENWTARGQRTVAMGPDVRRPTWLRDVTGWIELGTPNRLLVRGTLLVVLDLIVLGALAALASWLATGAIQRPTWFPEWRAFRTRLAVSLGAFFFVPAVGFALINIFELANDGRSRRDLEIGRDLAIADTLSRSTKDSTMRLGWARADMDLALETLGDQVDANLVLYKRGQLIPSTGADVLRDFGVLNSLIDAGIYHQIEIDKEPKSAADGPTSIVPTRIGALRIRLPTYELAILASPQAAAYETLLIQQLDLAYVLALALVVGLLAALVGANLSARALSRPAAELREAALAFGRGHPLPRPIHPPPTEFEPVFAALQKMADDIRASQESQERAARILAWGEMANQVAHEIKNPLTPMRLGIQHLRRVHRDGRPIGPTLEETSRRILGEIDRLDLIARAFSRFAAPAEGRPAPEPTNVVDVAREVVALYQLAPETKGVTVEAVDSPVILSQRDELKETLVNLIENARNADATSVVVRIEGPKLQVIDNGSGIEPEQLPQIFEPRFSTNTSGSGLGLAIVKRLVEGWGATISVESILGEGTVVTIQFEPALDAGQATIPKSAARNPSV